MPPCTQVCNVGFKGNAVETLALPEGISALPMCVDISADGTLLAICTDNNSEDEAIVVLTFPGLVKVRSFGSLTGDAARYIANPCVLAFAPSTNHILITEADNQRVQEFTVTGEHVRFIGEAPSTYDPTGSEPAPYGCIGGFCVGLAVNESVVVVGMWYDAANQIKVYDYASGNFVREFGPIGTNVSQLSSCFGIAFCGPNHSDVAIAEGDNGRVSVFSLDGAYVRTFGVGKVGRCLSVVSNPVGGFAIMPQSGHVTLFDDDCKVTGELSMLSADQESLPGSLFGSNGRLYTLGADSRSIVVYE